MILNPAARQEVNHQSRNGLLGNLKSLLQDTPKVKSDDLASTYLKNIKSSAYDLKLSSYAKTMISQLNKNKVRKHVSKKMTMSPHLGTTNTDQETNDEDPLLVFQSLSNYGLNGVLTQEFLMEFFMSSTERTLQYQNKIASIINSIAPGYHLKQLDHYTNTTEPDQMTLSIANFNKIRMRIRMAHHEEAEFLSIMHLNKNTELYELNLIKKQVLLTNAPQMPQDQAPIFTLNAQETIKNVAESNLDIDPHFNESESFDF